MSEDTEQSHSDRESKESSSRRSVLLTRGEAAALLHCSISGIRRLEGHTLHPVVGPDGVHRFDPIDLIRVASERSSPTVAASKEGERDARVFEALEDGKRLREIVTTMRLPVDVATKLHAAWLKMGDGHDMVLSNARLAQLRGALQADLKRPGDLVEEVLWLAEQRSTLEGERNNLDQQLSDLVAVVGKMTALDPDIAIAFSEPGKTLDPDLAGRLAARSNTSRTSLQGRRPAHPMRGARIRDSCSHSIVPPVQHARVCRRRNAHRARRHGASRSLPMTPGGFRK